MNPLLWFFLSSGIFLGWSLGANHAVNVFGTAVVSKMVKFKTAAIVAGIFVIIGSVIGGSGTTKTITELGAVNAIAGSFTVALAVAISVFAMTKAKLPVSTSQAVIGGIIGWNLFTGSPTDLKSLYKILSSWVVSPLLAAAFGFILFKIVKHYLKKWKIHLLEIDSYTRAGLIIVGALASYSLGANNIANVMGMFVSAPFFDEINLFGLIKISSVHQLYFLGGLSIAVGIFTYGSNVMETVGKDLYKISPITGLVVVFSEFLVLFLFTSQELESILLKLGLPTFPLVPLSTTQAFIGAVIGVGLAKDPLSINFKVFGKIAIGWLVAPLSAGLITFISLFFVQNVFEQKVVVAKNYEISNSIINELKINNVNTEKLNSIINKRFFSSREFKNELMKLENYNEKDLYLIFQYSIIDSFKVDSNKIKFLLTDKLINENQYNFIKKNHGMNFKHKLDFENHLFNKNNFWKPTGNKTIDSNLMNAKELVENQLRVKK
ncbi:MAG: anion permease [Melioribacteraceae bacterium]|nr:anion permease [Melioribacteraceae bacterium]